MCEPKRDLILLESTVESRGMYYVASLVMTLLVTRIYQVSET